MSTSGPGLPELNLLQEEALKDLQKRLRRQVQHTGEPETGSSRADLHCKDVHVPASSNVFGILGARGVGKSTVLTRLFRDEQPDQLQSRDSAGGLHLPDIVLIPPLDCSVLAPEVAPGTAVLMRVQQHLKKLLNPEREAAILDCLNSLVDRYSRTDRSYRDLCIDLSTTPADYSRHVRDGLVDRLELRAKLCEWLTAALGILKRRAFVVLLDDFDLVPAEFVRHWLFSLLDELHQPRLLFVLTADFHRLQHLSWDAEAHLDDKTGRALVDKLLPAHNHIELKDWPLDDKKIFRLFDGPNISEGTPRTESPDTLWEHLCEILPNGGTFPRLIEALLPVWPRGLENLYRSLQIEADRRRRDPGSAERDPCRELLPLLATCRGEPLLARLMEETAPGKWADLLDFPDDELSVEEWDDLVQSARSRGIAEMTETATDDDVTASQGTTKVHCALPALAALRPTTDRNKGTKKHSLADGVLTLLPVLATGWGARDPLRHERLQRQPLRDASEKDVPIWTELLLDIAFEYPRTRVRFLEHWTPAIRRTEDSFIQVEVSKKNLSRFLEVDGALGNRSVLYWISHTTAQRGTLNIGWRPLFQALRGAREPIPFDLLDELMVDTSALAGPLPDAGTAPELLPKELWASVLLVDGLDRCPWSAFSVPLGWELVTYLGVAAALVRSAYVHALVQAGALPPADLGEAQNELLEVLAQRDPGVLLRYDEEEVVERLTRLLNCPAPEIPDNPIASALKFYLASPVYAEVRDLIQHQAVAWAQVLNKPISAPPAEDGDAGA